MNFQDIYKFIINNFISIVIGIGLIGVALKIANIIIKIIAVLLVILIFMKIFFINPL